MPLHMLQRSPLRPRPWALAGVMLEDVLAVQSAERLQALGVAVSPRDPQDRRPSIGFLAQLTHSCYSPLSLFPSSKHWREASIPSLEELQPYCSSCPRPPLQCARCRRAAGTRPGRVAYPP